MANDTSTDARILVVDDEPDFLDVLKDSLAPLGCKLDMAANGKLALPMILGRRPDAVLSDLRMPGMDGLTLLKTVRDQGLQVPFVFLTGFGDRDAVATALRLDAFDFLEKPFDEARLQSVMRLAVEYGALLRSLDQEVALLCEFNDVPSKVMPRIQDIQRQLLLMRKQRLAFSLVKDQTRKVV